MIHSRSPLATPALLVAAAFGLAVAASAQDGIKQTEALVKKGESTIKSITDARLQLDKTLGTYNSIMEGKAPDTKAAYKDLEKQVKDCESRSEAVKKQKEAMDVEADKLYAAWAAGMADISSPDLKQRSEARLGQTKDRMAKIGAAGLQARGAYDEFLVGLKDQIKFLGHDLNPSAIASLKGDAAKLNAKAKTMFEKIDGTVA